jgi:hypothetical protein
MFIFTTPLVRFLYLYGITPLCPANMFFSLYLLFYIIIIYRLAYQNEELIMNPRSDPRPVVAGMEWLRAQRRSTEESWADSVVKALRADTRVEMSMKARIETWQCSSGVPSGLVGRRKKRVRKGEA